MLTKTYLKDLTYELIGSAIEVHKATGPGLMESIYISCMLHELSLRKINFVNESAIPVHYKGIDVSAHLRADIFVENCIVMEVKAVSRLNELFVAQLFTYMKLLKAPKGMLLNFNCINIYKEGQKTFVNELYKILPEI